MLAKIGGVGRVFKLDVVSGFGWNIIVMYIYTDENGGVTCGQSSACCVVRIKGKQDLTERFLLQISLQAGLPAEHMTY